MNNVEILAPAGNMDCLNAAFNAGADAVYLGGNLFGARAFEIFTAKERETLSRAIDLIEKDDSDTLSREAVLNLIAELNCTSFYEANDDSKETYYEIRDAIKNMSSGKTIKEETNVIS